MSKRAVRTTSSSKKDRQTDPDPSSLNALEQRVVAIAEQVGRIAGSAQATTDNWFDQPRFKKQLARLRGGAADLLKQIAAISSRQGQGRLPAKRSPKGRSGGKVDAPGKKHRKAPELLHGVKHSDEKIAKALAARRMQPGRARQE
jgi:hypothetical protein